MIVGAVLYPEHLLLLCSFCPCWFCSYCCPCHCQLKMFSAPTLGKARKKGCCTGNWRCLTLKGFYLGELMWAVPCTSIFWCLFLPVLTVQQWNCFMLEPHGGFGIRGTQGLSHCIYLQIRDRESWGSCSAGWAQARTFPQEAVNLSFTVLISSGVWKRKSIQRQLPGKRGMINKGCFNCLNWLIVELHCWVSSLLSKLTTYLSCMHLSLACICS